MDWIAVLTGTFVLVTGYYAWQTHETVDELRKSREISLLPKIGVHFHMLGPTYPIVQIGNVGPGPAFDVDYVLIFVGKNPEDSESRPWRANVLAPREFHRFYIPEAVDEAESRTSDLVERYVRIRVMGTMKDALGNRKAIEERLEDLEEWLRVTTEARAMWDREPLERIASTLEHIRTESRSRPQRR